MYAIRRIKSKRWLHDVDQRYPITSTKRVRLHSELPVLFAHQELARLEMLENRLSVHAYEIVEVEVCLKNAITCHNL